MQSVKINKTSIIDSGVVMASFIGIVILAVLYFLYPKLISLFLMLGVLVYAGFITPRLINKSIREQRSLEAKSKECQQWGFHSRDREGPWINAIDYALVKSCKMSESHYFYSEWLIIHDGLIIINPGYYKLDSEKKQVSYEFENRRVYSWDGCSPKKSFFWFSLLGTPDWWHGMETVQYINSKGVIDTKTVFWPKAHHASLVHDALYQYLGLHSLSKHEVDTLFYEMLKDSGMNVLVAYMYYVFVDCFGAYDISKHHRPAKRDLKTDSLPLKVLNQ